MKITTRICSVLVLLLGISSFSLQAQTVVITNPSVPSSSISAKELLDVYTLNKAHWDDGSRITVFDLKGGKAKEAFYEHLGMSEQELQRIWLRKQFTGKARPPRSVSNEDDVVHMVGRTPGGIGYVSERAAAGNKNVRIVARIK
jgi:ABC-type phosphate transport system substrate-binding protein